LRTVSGLWILFFYAGRNILLFKQKQLFIMRAKFDLWAALQ
jgi:hypothetical protein